MADTKVILGTAFVTDKGTWATGTAYEQNDIVHHGSGIYMSLADGNTTEPSTGNEQWRLWVDLAEVNTATDNANTATATANEAEATRETAFASSKEACDTATGNAETATSNANTATTSANNAAAAALAAKEAVEGTEVGQLAVFLKVTAHAIAELQAEIDGLKERVNENLGNIKAQNLDLENLPQVVATDFYSQGSGAPSFIPMFIGQEYMDTDTGTLYKCYKVTASTNDWKSTK